MHDDSSPQPAPHDPLAVLRGQFPGWEAWRGVSGLLYVRRRMTSPPVVLRGTPPSPSPSRYASTRRADSSPAVRTASASGQSHGIHETMIRTGRCFLLNADRLQPCAKRS